MNKSIIKLGIGIFCFAAIAHCSSVYGETSKLLAQNPSRTTRPTLKPGIYHAGSRYITIVGNGKRFCYEGVSLPPGRYAVAVGETIGSLSPTSNGFIIDGFKKKGIPIIIRQGKNKLLISNLKFDAHDMEYDFLESNTGKVEGKLKQCLDSKGDFLIPVPGSGYKIP